LTGFDPGEIDGLLALEDDEKANAAPPLPETPVSRAAICGYSDRTASCVATPRPRTLYWFQHEPCWFVRKKNAPWFGKAGENSTIWNSPLPKFIMGSSDEEKWIIPRKNRSN
jgi:hypothetical protein